MSVKYNDYEAYFSKITKDFHWDDLKKYIEELWADESHIAFKFKQTINYLRFKHIEDKYIDGESLPIAKLAETIDGYITDPVIPDLKVIELAPPPIFITSIVLKPLKGDGLPISFDTLSSGEKQLIYSVSSILYHLINLESVKSTVEKPKHKYEFVNIIFEEIELYFHPETQRRYIKHLRDSIERLELKTVLGINMIFVTHSPFILSDIPAKQIMFLKISDNKAVQIIEDKRTFGANIHNLLNDGFFMQKGFCGAFAIEKLNDIIKSLNDKTELNRLLELEKDGKELNDEQRYAYKAMAKNVSGRDFKNYRHIISTVGENIVANKLTEMYEEAFGIDQDERLNKEISRLQGLLKNK